jgi:hypothetical protein
VLCCVVLCLAKLNCFVAVCVCLTVMCLHLSACVCVCVVSPDVRDVYFGSLDGTFEGFTFVDDSAEKMLMGAGAGHKGGA